MQGASASAGNGGDAGGGSGSGGDGSGDSDNDSAASSSSSSSSSPSRLAMRAGASVEAAEKWAEATAASSSSSSSSCPVHRLSTEAIDRSEKCRLPLKAALLGRKRCYPLSIADKHRMSPIDTRHRARFGVCRRPSPAAWPCPSRARGPAALSIYACAGWSGEPNNALVKPSVAYQTAPAT